MLKAIWFVIKVLFVVALAYFCTLGIIVWLMGKILVVGGKVAIGSSGGYI